jgi:hypothetical protein
MRLPSPVCSSRAESGSTDASSASLTSLTGAIDLASDTHQPGQTAPGADLPDLASHRLQHPQPVRLHDGRIASRSGQRPAHIRSAT